MPTGSTTLAWKMPCTEEPGRLQSIGSKRVIDDWATSLLMNEAACCYLLLGCLTLFHLNRVKAGLAIHIYSVLSAYIFASQTVQCWYTRTVFTQLWMYWEMCYLEAEITGNMTKTLYFSCESRIVASSNHPGKHTGSLFCALWWQLWPLFFQKEYASGHFLLGSHHPVQFYRISLTAGMAVTEHSQCSTLTEHSPVRCFIFFPWNPPKYCISNSFVDYEFYHISS